MCGFAGFTGYLADGDAVLERMMNKIIQESKRIYSPDRGRSGRKDVSGNRICTGKRV